MIDGRRPARSGRVILLAMALSPGTILPGCGSPVVDATGPPYGARQSGLPPTAILPAPSTAGGLDPSARVTDAPPSPPTAWGDTPQVPASAVVPQPQDVSSGRYHTVRKGDTLSAIARQYGTTVERLLDDNGLERTAILQPGQMIYVP